MNWHKFGAFAPLMLVMNGSEKYRLVKSVGDAAEALFASWPLDDGEEYLVAVKTCLEALHGTASPAEARSALIRAAEEAGIPVITVVHCGSQEQTNTGMVWGHRREPSMTIIPPEPTPSPKPGPVPDRPPDVPDPPVEEPIPDLPPEEVPNPTPPPKEFPPTMK
ncbi:hypothetical protein GGE12_002042 [Rhizobium mongolense]|uniref:DUF982 domain-containing protein n=1 Tax=Rhizobium mongolense TaxID=57676 RepID=A0A7W6RKU3_9HYPH|nr:hypothetical protein [Rhizobium mongolense]